MNRCDVIDLLEDKYGLNKDELSKRELAIIGLCTNELVDYEEQELNLHLVSKSLPIGKMCVLIGRIAVTDGFPISGEEKVEKLKEFVDLAGYKLVEK